MRSTAYLGCLLATLLMACTHDERPDADRFVVGATYVIDVGEGAPQRVTVQEVDPEGKRIRCEGAYGNDYWVDLDRIETVVEKNDT